MCVMCELNLVSVRVLWVIFVSVRTAVQPIVPCGSEHAECSRKGACGLCRIWKPAKDHFIADFMYFS